MHIHYQACLSATETAMPRPTKDKAREKLRNAVVADAVENGLGSVSVAGVVKRARVSAGTVYVHFANKDDMLREVYMEIKAEFHAAIMRAANIADPAEMIRAMWFNVFDFVGDRPQDLLFLEFGSVAKILTPEQKAIVEGYSAEIAALLRRGVDAGVLAPLDPDVLSLLLVSPAMQLARRAILTGAALSPSTIEQTFERVWLSIAANPT